MGPARTLRLACAVLAAFWVSACGEGGTQPEPLDPVLTLIAGDGQTAMAGEPVSEPLVVGITQDGNPVAGQVVTWTVASGGGSVDPSSSSTDAAGLASTTWTLGPNVGDNVVRASASGVSGSPVTFAATGTLPPSPPPTEATVSVADNVFNPSDQRIAVGGTVTWSWTGSNPHNVTFQTGPSSNTQTSGSFERTFQAEGSFAYECTIHSGMTATITVE